MQKQEKDVPYPNVTSDTDFSNLHHWSYVSGGLPLSFSVGNKMMEPTGIEPVQSLPFRARLCRLKKYRPE